MSSKKFEKGSREWYMFTDYWTLCQKFWLPENNDEYWENLVNSINDFAQKYNNDFFARKLALALSDYLEDEAKKGKNERHL